MIYCKDKEVGEIPPTQTERPKIEFLNVASTDLDNYKKKVKKVIDKYFPEKPIRCMAEALKYGSGQAERNEIKKELNL